MLGDIKKRIKKKGYATAFDLPNDMSNKVSKEQKDYWYKILSDSGLDVPEDTGCYKGKKSIIL